MVCIIININTVIAFVLNIGLICLLVLYPGTSVKSQTTSTDNNSSIPVYTYFIVNKIPHDFNAYTQGLVFSDGYLYESTGGSLESFDQLSCFVIPPQGEGWEFI